jgi:hypothetical protein
MAGSLRSCDRTFAIRRRLRATRGCHSIGSKGHAPHQGPLRISCHIIGVENAPANEKRLRTLKAAGVVFV